MTTMLAAIKRQPWIIFLILSIAVQQFALLLYKYGAMHTLPQVFMTYSFGVQCVCSLIAATVFKNRGFPIVLKNKMRWFVVLVGVVLLFNELIWVSIYHIGGPYALVLAISSTISTVILVLIGILFFKEKINRYQFAGICLAILSIIMIKLG